MQIRNSLWVPAPCIEQTGSGSFYIEKTPGKIAFNPGQGGVRASTACLAHSGYAESGAVAALHWATKRGAPHTLSWPGLAETAPV